MPNYNTNWDADEDDDTNDAQQQQNDPKSLRAYARKTAKENEDLKTRLAAMEAANRKNAVAQVIRDKGFNPKIAGFVPEAVGADAEAIEKWLDENADVFGGSQNTKGRVAEPEDDADDDEIDGGSEVEEQDFDRASWDRMSRAANSAMPATKRADLASKLNDPNLTKEKLDQILSALGNQKVMPFK